MFWKPAAGVGCVGGLAGPQGARSTQWFMVTASGVEPVAATGAADASYTAALATGSPMRAINSSSWLHGSDNSCPVLALDLGLVHAPCAISTAIESPTAPRAAVRCPDAPRRRKPAVRLVHVSELPQHGVSL